MGRGQVVSQGVCGGQLQHCAFTIATGHLSFRETSLPFHVQEHRAGSWRGVKVSTAAKGEQTRCNMKHKNIGRSMPGPGDRVRHGFVRHTPMCGTSLSLFLVLVLVVVLRLVHILAVGDPSLHINRRLNPEAPFHRFQPLVHLAQHVSQ